MSENGPSSEFWKRTWNVFHQVVELPPGDRPEALSRLCGGDTGLRTEVEELLGSHDEGLPLIEQSPKFDPAEFEETVARQGLLEPGIRLADRFEIVGLVGMGGMGEVYEARDEELGTRVAVKTLLPGLSADPVALARFRKEILMARQVTHRNVCRLFDLVQDGDTTFLTMEFLEGETLASKLKREGKLELAETRAILNQLVAGLGAAHDAGVVHRDLKPSNVFLTREDSGTRVVVTDFGLATSDAGQSKALAHLTGTGEILGTPAYMAPEQLAGHETGPATDIYALGLLLYEMVTGKLPFSGTTAFSIASRRLEGPAPSPRTHLPELDSRWESVILRCLERHPSERFESSDELVRALEGEATVATARTSSATGGLSRLGLAGVLVLVVALAAAVWFWQRSTRGVPSSPVSEGGVAFEPPDLLIASFDNRTGEDVFTGSLETALSRELSSSRLVDIVPTQRVADTLRLMGRSLDTVIDTEVGQEIALRDGEVPFVLIGRIERLGTTYFVGADLTRPEDGEIVTSLSAEADSQDGVLEAVRELAEDVQEALHTALEDPVERQNLPPVSTPSLAALKLFTQADRLFIEEVIGGPDRNEAAERLLKEAIDEDPEFASAYLHLGYAMMRQGRSAEESLPHFEKALELSDGASPAERAFIRATYHADLAALGGPEGRSHLEEALAQYRTLLELDPAHFWGAGNLAILLDEIGRGSEAVELVVENAEIHHRNNAARQRLAAWFVVRYEGNVAAARRYVDRAFELTELAGLTGGPFYQLGEALRESLATHELWLAGDLDGLVKRLHENVERTPSLTGYIRDALPSITTMHMVDLGMFRRATEVVELYGGWSPEGWERFLSLRRQDSERLRETLPREAGDDPETTAARALDLVNVGLLEEAELLLESLPEALSPGARGNAALVQGTAELARGRPRQAVSLLSEALNSLMTQDYLATYFMAALRLAKAWQEIGYPERAALVLEDASRQRDRLIRGARFYWMLVELGRANIYRELGRTEEAAEIEARLWLLCSYADPDFPILRELERRQDPPPLG